MTSTAPRRGRVFTAVRYVIGLFGYTLTRTSPHRHSYHIHRGRGAYDRSRQVPPELASILDDRHPDLVQLRARYARFSSPYSAGHYWQRSRRLRDLDLRYFRGDNAYVWQLRQLGDNARLKNYLYLSYLAAFDSHKLLQRLTEDGAFGCWAFSFTTAPTVSRDLLDSINEIYFLDRHFGLFDRQSLTVIDIGAGYGRLAHRMAHAVPGLSRYLCVDAIAESTYLSRHYLDYRGIGDKAAVLPIDTMERQLRGVKPDLAVNIHSFSEMPYSAIDAWLALLVDLDVKALLIVPNEGDRLLSLEEGCLRRDFSPLLARHGFRLAASEPVIDDPDVRELMGVGDYFFYFERETAGSGEAAAAAQTGQPT